MSELELHDDTFRLLVSSVEDYAIFVLDAEGRIRSWNAGAQRIKGYTADEVVGRHVSIFYPEGDRGWEALMEAARREGHAERHGWRVRKDGSRFWASVTMTALRTADGGLLGYAKVTRDLTDRAYRTFLESVNAIVWTGDASGQLNADAPTWRAFTGQTEAELRRDGPAAAVHPEDRARLEVSWQQALRDGSKFEAELRLRRHDGVYVWMQSRAVPLRDPDGNVREWFSASVDISARKAADEDRARARAWLETTLRSIGDGVIATDDHGRVVFMNAVAERMTAWTTAEAAGRPLDEVFEIVNETTRAPVANPVERVLREGIVVGLANHTVLLRKDGGELPIDDSAAPIRTPGGALDGVVLVFRDASQEKREIARREFLAHAGAQLVAASDYRDALRRIAQLAVPRLADWCAVEIVTDPQSGATEQLALAHVDPAKVSHARELRRRYPPDRDASTGVPNVLRTGRPELYPESPRELLSAAALDDEHRRIIEALDLRSAMVVPLRGRDRVFGAITFVYTGERRYDDADLAIAEDLARRAGMVLERRRLEEEAAAASRAKDEFLAMLGHELRNPLAPIRTALQLMSLRGDESTMRERKIIERQVEHLVTLVDDLLDVSRITRAKIKLHKERLELSAVIARALEMAGPLFEQRHHQIEVEVPRSGLKVDGDPARLAQVFSNLLTNAAKYTDPGGRVVVRARRDGERVIAEVTDSGIGIDPVMLPKIFDMFVQGPQSIARSHGGLGLGLNIAKSLVVMHGGAIMATSEGRGRGSTFIVELPAIEPAVATDVEPGPPADAVTERPSGDHRVLLVDDNEDAVALLEEIVQTFGYETRRAPDGPSALAIAERFDPEIAVLDIGLPVMDGYELAARLRERRPGLGLIAVTGYGQDEEQRKTRAAGFAHHFVKPVEVEKLRAALEAMTDGAGDRPPGGLSGPASAASSRRQNAAGDGPRRS